MLDKKGFTLLEIITVLIIVGILAAIAIPNYATNIKQRAARAAQNNLMIIYTAEKNFYFGTIGNGKYCTTSICPGTSCCDTTADINTNLQLNITDNYFTYACPSAGANSFTCTATTASIPGGLTLTLSNNPMVLTGGTGCATAGGASCNPSCSPSNGSYCP